MSKSHYFTDTAQTYEIGLSVEKDGWRITFIPAPFLGKQAVDEEGNRWHRYVRPGMDIVMRVLVPTGVIDPEWKKLLPPATEQYDYWNKPVYKQVCFKYLGNGQYEWPECPKVRQRITLWQEIEGASTTLRKRDCNSNFTREICVWDDEPIPEGWSSDRKACDIRKKEMWSEYRIFYAARRAERLARTESNS